MNARTLLALPALVLGSTVAHAQVYTTSAPTKTERDAYEHAATAFEPVLARMRQIATETLPAVERQLEGAGAGFTPSRLPAWQRK